MNILLNTLADPIWQVLALVITLAAPVLIVVVCTRDMHASEQQKRRDTLTSLGVACYLPAHEWGSGRAASARCRTAEDEQQLH